MASLSVAAGCLVLPVRRWCWRWLLCRLGLLVSLILLLCWWLLLHGLQGLQGLRLRLRRLLVCLILGLWLWDGSWLLVLEVDGGDTGLGHHVLDVSGGRCSVGADMCGGGDGVCDWVHNRRLGDGRGLPCGAGSLPFGRRLPGWFLVLDFCHL